MTNSQIHMHSWGGGSTLDKGLFEDKSALPLEKLNDLVQEALKFDYYISISPSKALQKEFEEVGDILVMFSDRKLTQR